MSSEFDRQALIGIFVAEAEDSLEKLSGALHPPADATPLPATVREQYIVAHTLKGASALYGYAGVAALTDVLETLVEGSADCSSGDWEKTVSMLRDLVSTIQAQILSIKERGQEEVGCFDQWVSRHALLLPPGVAPVAAPPDTPPPQAGFDLPDDYLLPEVDPEVISYFAPEAQEYLEAMESALLRIEKSPDDPSIVQELFRTAHTLKGSAHTVGFKSIGDLIHHVEDLVGAVRDGHVKMTSDLADSIFRAVDVVKMLMRRDSALLGQIREDYRTLQRRLRDVSLSVGIPVYQEPLDRAVPITTGMPTSAVSSPERRAEAENHKEGESRSEEAAVIRVSRDRLERLLNLVGELVISRGRLEQRLLSLEQLSNQLLGFKGRMLEAVRTFEEQHAFTLPAVTTQSTVTSQGPVNLDEIHGVGDFSVLEFDRYDDFNILARRLTEVSADVGESMAQLNGSIRKAREDMAQLQRLSLSMRDEIARARMVPVGTPFVRFQRAVREMARLTGKQATLVTAGEHTEVDTGVVERLIDPLVHLVRNAVYHGIERPEIRQAQGKPAVGTVYLSAAHRGNAVVIEVEDDGAGIDLERVKSKAISLGLLHADSAARLSDAEVIKFIFMPGFSTATEVGEVAGRGVGMDVVKQTLEGMNGQIEVETELGVGTKFTLRLPLTLLISTALLVRVADQRYALPLPNIREVVVPASGMVEDLGGRPVLQTGHEAIDVESVGRLLGIESTGTIATSPIVIVRTATGVQGLAVDELLGRQEIVIKALSTLKRFQESFFIGATIDPEGRVVLVLDLARLLAGRRSPSHTHAVIPDAQAAPACDENEGTPSESVRSETIKLLLIDDSLSIRKFVGKMLEGAGYAVETAVDGEEGLRKAASGEYRLIITDLEMPKLNGYEVIQALRDRVQTKSTPILVMTTRAGEKHRQLALGIGASGYIAKPVEERSLLLEIERWSRTVPT